MMKIDPNLTIGQVSPPTSVRPASRKGAFEEVLSGIEQKTATAASELPPLTTALLDPQKIQALSLSEQALELLDGYAQALADPRQTLRALKPMADELASLRTDLEEQARALAGDDPLKAIMQDVSATIDAQMIQFARGDLLG